MSKSYETITPFMSENKYDRAPFMSESSAKADAIDKNTQATH